MKILIIGGTGFIGGAVAEQAQAAGHDVVLFNRGLSDASTSYDVINGDVDNLASFKKELLALKPDVVVHSIAYTEKHAQDLVSMFEGTASQLIVLGSCDCYEAFWQMNRGEDKADYPVREDSPLCKTPYYWKNYNIGKLSQTYDKNLMTDILMKAAQAGKVQATVFRLPFVYGPKDRQYAGRHGNLIKHILDHELDMVLSTTEQSSLYTYAYVGNVAAAVVHSFGLQQTFGQIYNLGDAEVRTRRRWADLYAENAGCKFTYRILPPELKDKDGVLNGAPENFIMDTSKFKKDTGFQEPVSVKEAVKRTYDWAVQHPEALKGISIDYASYKALADMYETFITAVNKKSNPPPPKL